MPTLGPPTTLAPLDDAGSDATTSAFSGLSTARMKRSELGDKDPESTFGSADVEWSNGDCWCSDVVIIADDEGGGGGGLVAGSPVELEVKRRFGVEVSSSMLELAPPVWKEEEAAKDKSEWSITLWNESG